MADIFSSAARVVVWLGRDADNSGLALDRLHYLGEQVVTRKSLDSFPSPSAAKPYWFRSDLAIPYDEETWDSIHKLIDREWFKRLWVVQGEFPHGTFAMLF